VSHGEATLLIFVCVMCVLGVIGLIILGTWADPHTSVFVDAGSLSALGFVGALGLATMFICATSGQEHLHRQGVSTASHRNAAMCVGCGEVYSICCQRGRSVQQALGTYRLTCRKCGVQIGTGVMRPSPQPSAFWYFPALPIPICILWFGVGLVVMLRALRRVKVLLAERFYGGIVSFRRFFWPR